VATIRLDNPPLNAISLPVVHAVVSALGACRADDEVRAIVFTGSARAFSAGADVHEFEGLDGVTGATVIDAYRAMVAAVRNCRKPTIAAIRGFCLGGGLELALGCDVRVAAEDALLGVPEATLGLLPGAGATQVLPRMVGSSRAALLCSTGRTITGATAAQWGLVDEVTPSERVKGRTLELATSLSSRSPHALATLSRLLDASATVSLEEGLALEREAFLACLGHPDGREGIRAFLERRPPRWESG